MTPRHGVAVHKGRGALSNATGRFERITREDFDDGWGDGRENDRDDGQDHGKDHGQDHDRSHDDLPPPKLRTTLTPDTSRRIISYNASPDLPFDRSINPYRGCEHGCIYCYARPSHAYLGFSPGLDFETQIVFKPDAASLLRAELGKPSYRCAPIALGSNTDPYQPVERDLGITRAILEVLAECGHPVMIVTKSARVERDIDILGAMAGANRCSVGVSVATLDRSLARRMDPRASAPHRRLETVRRLTAAGIPTGVLVSPMIPFINDAELEAILEHASEAGALGASYTMLRLPLEIADLFREWLAEHISRPRRAGDGTNPRHPRRQGLRLDVRRTHARHRTGGGAAREAIPARDEAPGVPRLSRPRQLGIHPARHRSVASSRCFEHSGVFHAGRNRTAEEPTSSITTCVGLRCANPT